MGPFSRLCKGFEDIRRSTLDEATPVLVNKQIKLVKQAMILFEQASNATTYWKMYAHFKALDGRYKERKQYLEGEDELPL